VSITKPDQPVL